MDMPLRTTRPITPSKCSNTGIDEQPINMGMPSRRRVVSPFRRTLLRRGSSPRSAPCCAELCAKWLDPKYSVCFPYFARILSTPS